jgi:hypothetical protein
MPCTPDARAISVASAAPSPASCSCMQMTGGAAKVACGPCDPTTLHPDLNWLQHRLEQPSPPRMVVMVNPCNPTGAARTPHRHGLIWAEGSCWQPLGIRACEREWVGQHGCSASPRCGLGFRVLVTLCCSRLWPELPPVHAHQPRACTCLARCALGLRGKLAQQRLRSAGTPSTDASECSRGFGAPPGRHAQALGGDV